MKDSFKIWMMQIRGNFLVLSVVLVALGLSLSALQMKNTGIGNFNLFHAILIAVGVVLTHISVNLFNEYSDYITGIDFKTNRTPFSGGSGMLQSGKTTPEGVYTAAVQTLFFAFLIGLYFVMVSSWSLLIIIAVGGVAIVYYTGYLARMLLGELFAGLTLGSLVVLGTFIAMTAEAEAGIGPHLNAGVILISLPPGILTSLLLFLNEFPDAEADKEGGRLHLVIWLGKKRASYLYVAGLLLTYLIIIMLPPLKLAGWWILLALLTLPLALRAAITALLHYDDMGKLIPAMGMNVAVVLATDALLALGVFLSAVI